MNWDKPLTLATLRDSNWGGIDHHGYKVGVNFEWDKFMKDVGYRGKGSYEELYDSYLSYCKLMSSPLGKALE